MKDPALAALMQAHPLHRLDFITVRLKYDPASKCYVTSIPELFGISTYGETVSEALDETRDLILGFLASAEAHNQRIPLDRDQIEKIRAALTA